MFALLAYASIATDKITLGDYLTIIVLTSILIVVLMIWHAIRDVAAVMAVAAAVIALSVDEDAENAEEAGGDDPAGDYQPAEPDPAQAS